MVLSGATLRSGQPDDILGKSIVVHEKADDYKTQPAGDSGKRIACSIIK
jgi:superoxide dismutase, Cu-Zn family